jgi:hypothetical protein
VSTRRSDRTGRRLLPPVGSWSPTRVVALPCGHPRGRCCPPASVHRGRTRPPARRPRSTAPRSMLPRSSRCWTPEVALGSGSCSACRRPCGARCRADGRSRRRWLGRAWATSPWRHRGRFRPADESQRTARAASRPSGGPHVRSRDPPRGVGSLLTGGRAAVPGLGRGEVVLDPGRSWDRRVPGARQRCANQLEDATEHSR